MKSAPAMIPGMDASCGVLQVSRIGTRAGILSPALWESVVKSPLHGGKVKVGRPWTGHAPPLHHGFAARCEALEAHRFCGVPVRCAS